MSVLGGNISIWAMSFEQIKYNIYIWVKCSSEYVIIQMVTIQPGKPSAALSHVPTDHIFSVYFILDDPFYWPCYLYAPQYQNISDARISLVGLSVCFCLFPVSAYTGGAGPGHPEAQWVPARWVHLQTPPSTRQTDIPRRNCYPWVQVVGTPGH